MHFLQVIPSPIIRIYSPFFHRETAEGSGVSSPEIEAIFALLFVVRLSSFGEKNPVIFGTVAAHVWRGIFYKEVVLAKLFPEEWKI